MTNTIVHIPVFERVSLSDAHAYVHQFENHYLLSEMMLAIRRRKPKNG